MAGFQTGILTKLTLIPLENESDVVDNKKGIDVLINPKEITHNFIINYNEQAAPGDSKPSPKFDKAGKETLDFKITIDGTGVVTPPNSKKPVNVTEEVGKIRQKFGYDGKIHQPKYVAVLWGSLLFRGVLTKLNIQYVLFKPSGVPIRATVDFGINGFTSVEESLKLAGKTSPDLTHIVEVKSGDTLPLLCYRIYKESAYYTQIAKINKLVNFRKLKPGTKLVFPPLN